MIIGRVEGIELASWVRDNIGLKFALTLMMPLFLHFQTLIMLQSPTIL